MALKVYHPVCIIFKKPFHTTILFLYKIVESIVLKVSIICCCIFYLLLFLLALLYLFLDFARLLKAVSLYKIINPFFCYLKFSLKVFPQLFSDTQNLHCQKSCSIICFKLTIYPSNFFICSSVISFLLFPRLLLIF